jgi:hypothetical protein
MPFHTWNALYSSTGDPASQKIDREFVAFKRAFNDAPDAHAKIDLVRKSNAAGILCITKVSETSFRLDQGPIFSNVLQISG